MTGAPRPPPSIGPGRSRHPTAPGPRAVLAGVALLLVAAADYDARVDALAGEIEARPANAALRAEVERARAKLPTDPGPALRARLEAHGLDAVRVPGLFYERFPETGADLRAAERWLGAPVRRIDTDETGTVEGNAAVVARALRAAPRPVLAVTASKGSADLRAALEGEPSLGAHVAIWLDLVGVLEGTPLLDSSAGDAAAGELGLPAATRRSLGSGVRRESARPERFPPETRAVHVAAFPHVADVSRRALRAFEVLRPLGANDGYVLLDAYRRAPGRVLIVRGADHYLRLESAEQTLTALLWVLLDELGAPPPAP